MPAVSTRAAPRATRAGRAARRARGTNYYTSKQIKAIVQSMRGPDLRNNEFGWLIKEYVDVNLVQGDSKTGYRFNPKFL